MSNGTAWSAEQIQILKKMHADKKSAQEIADRLGTVSRAAVLGKIMRLGLSKSSAPRPEKKVRPKVSPRSLVPLPPIFAREEWKPRTAPVEPLNISMLDLEANQCRYATTDDKPFLFCGLVTQDGSSYCPEHHAICWVQPKRLNLSDAERERRRKQIRRINNHPPVFSEAAE